jgi:hypothetical protein
MTQRTTRWLRVGLVALIASLEPALSHAQSPIASGELDILGAQLAVSPADQTVPKNQATALTVQLVDAADSFSALPIAGLGTLFVNGTLTGPGIVTPRELSIDISTPSVATADVIDRVIVTSVSSRPLSLQEIQDRGIVLDASNFSAFEFTFGVGTGSNQVPISFDVAFPQDKPTGDDAGRLCLPPVVPGLEIPNLEVKGLMLESPPLFDDKVEIPPIPAVIVIPGTIAVLNQFFQVLVLVSNVAPAGSHPVVTSATATLTLPVGADGIAHWLDDPLAFAGTQAGTPAPPKTTSGLRPASFLWTAPARTPEASGGRVGRSRLPSQT